MSLFARFVFSGMYLSFTDAKLNLYSCQLLVFSWAKQQHGCKLFH